MRARAPCSRVVFPLHHNKHLCWTTLNNNCTIDSSVCIRKLNKFIFGRGTWNKNLENVVPDHVDYYNMNHTTGWKLRKCNNCTARDGREVEITRRDKETHFSSHPNSFLISLEPGRCLWAEGMWDVMKGKRSGEKMWCLFLLRAVFHSSFSGLQRVSSFFAAALPLQPTPLSDIFNIYSFNFSLWLRPNVSVALKVVFVGTSSSCS